MLYLLVRIIAIMILILIVFLTFKKSFLRFNKRKSRIIMAGIIVVLFYILLLIPFENFVIKFHSPIDVFKYTFLNQNILRVIENDDCAFIIYGKDGSSVSCISFQKEEGGWRIHSPYVSSGVRLESFGKYHIISNVATNCNKKLILVSEGNLPKPMSDIKISDNKNSKFESFFSKYKYVDYYTVFYYTIVDATIIDYQLIINGQVLSVY